MRAAEVARFRSVPRLDPDAAARHWFRGLGEVKERTPARALYSGRGFQEAVNAATALSAQLVIASAGLGLISSDALVPAYEATIVPGAPDSICACLGTSPQNWWRALTRLTQCEWPSQDTLLLVALSRPYLEMLEGDLLKRDPEQIRIFTRTPPDRLHPGIRMSVMPYDARFDAPGGPCPGTIADFAQRALAHFSRHILPQSPVGDLTQHRDLVSTSLSSLIARSRRQGTPMPDQELKAVIRAHYAQVGGRSSRMLRRLRDDLGLACEQSRFSRLFREVQISLVRETQCLPL